MNLPPLPEPEYPAVRLGINRNKLAYTAEQMLAYGQALEALVWAGDLTQVACDYKPLHNAIAALRARLGETR